MENRNNTQFALALAPLSGTQPLLVHPHPTTELLIDQWLAELLWRAVGQYAEHKSPMDRSLQCGESWCSFQYVFAPFLRRPLGYALTLSWFYRFARSDDSHTNSLRGALEPLSLEAEVTRGIIRGGTLNFFLRRPSFTLHSELGTADGLPRIVSATQCCKACWSPLNHPRELNGACKATLIRWCAWLDAVLHLRVHTAYHSSSPDCFHPDPELRYLAALGHTQRYLGHRDALTRFYWTVDFNRALLKYGSTPKWNTFCKAVAADIPRAWAYPDIDTSVIALWPLVKRFNWTYRDLLNVLRLPNSPPSLHNRFQNYPASSEREFAAYCRTVLGLRKAGKGVSSANTLPKGHEIAERLFRN